MSRVHCIDCATAVVVDPAGRCPDGHLVGAAGARIETAIGSDTGHPDEPVPWVGQVVLDDAPAPQVEAPRPIRPVAVPGIELDDGAPADSEELLRELHSLSELGAELGSLDDLGGVLTSRREPVSRPPGASPRPAPGHRDAGTGAPPAPANGAAPTSSNGASPSAPAPAAAASNGATPHGTSTDRATAHGTATKGAPSHDPSGNRWVAPRTAAEVALEGTATEAAGRETSAPDRPRLTAVPDAPPPTSATATTAPAPSPATPPAGTSSRDDALSELTALEAAVQALDDRTTGSTDQLDAIADLFATVQERDGSTASDAAAATASGAELPGPSTATAAHPPTSTTAAHPPTSATAAHPPTAPPAPATPPARSTPPGRSTPLSPAAPAHGEPSAAVPAPRPPATPPSPAAVPAPSASPTTSTTSEPMSFTARTGGRRAAAAAKGKRRLFGR